MRSLVYEGPRTMKLREQMIPEPADDEVLVKVERAGICGSELGGYLGHNSLRKPPLIMGHEFSGSVAAIGKSVHTLTIGQRITVNPLISCGSCIECTTGFAQLCSRRSLLGAHRPGAYAEYVIVPSKNAYALEDHVTFDHGALTEPFACAVHVCRLLKLSPTDRLLIMGAGPIGLFILQAAKIFGLSNIVILDINNDRLDVATRLGGVAVSSLKDLSNGSLLQGFDCAVDAVGMQITRFQCVQSVKPGGRVVFTGLHEEESNLPINYAIRSEIQLMGAFAYTPYDFETALKWISEDRIELLPWTVKAPLEQGTECFEKLITNPGNIVKILLTM
jgi:2-desacetyl-2-hydroxyethyl bacteriochlorophyllide A dehydrogenase